MGRRAPLHVGEALRGALEAVEPATLLAGVQSAWAGAVGEAIAAEASPVAERDGIVTVACSSATWTQELDLLSDQILARLRAELSSEAELQGLRFTLRRDPV